ncbi:MAG TPA: hypothetical protein VIM86_03645 [Thermodesulfobacteriota bacterium]
MHDRRAMARTRSPNYPALPLEAAVRLAQALWKQEKRTTVPAEVAVRAWGYASLSGPARVRLASLKRYGLVEDDGEGVRVSALGMRLALEPPRSEGFTRALHEAALRPDLFRQLHDSHRDASDDALRSHLIFDRHFSEAGARLAVRAFRETMAAAGLDAPPRNGTPAAPHGAGPSGGPPAADGPTRGRVFTWPLSRGVVAEVRFSDGELRPAHFEELRQYLRLAIAILGNDEETA